MYSSRSDVLGKIKTIQERISYLEAHPEEVRTWGGWDYQPYSECTHLGLLKAELEMLLGVAEILK